MIDCAAFLDKDQDSVQPVFVAVLLIKGSGKPPLGKKADKKWGGQNDYEAYKKNTSVLVPAVHKYDGGKRLWCAGDLSCGWVTGQGIASARTAAGGP